jgi:hypothetical protein
LDSPQPASSPSDNATSVRRSIDEKSMKRLLG